MQRIGCNIAPKQGRHSVAYEAGQRTQCPICTGPMRLSSQRKSPVCNRPRGVRALMTNDAHDQDAEPPTSDGEEPDQEQLQAGSEPAGDPDPDPDAGTTPTHSEEDA
jgi:hypothetical protein